MLFGCFGFLMFLLFIVFPAVSLPIVAYELFWVDFDYGFMPSFTVFYGLACQVFLIWGIIRFFKPAKEEPNVPDKKKKWGTVCRLGIITLILFLLVRFSLQIAVGAAMLFESR
jgi:hypothetical protein